MDYFSDNADQRPAFYSYFLAATAWYALLLATAMAVDAAGPGPARLTAAAFSHWDAEHYRYIRDHGYDLERTAFFPLFPFLWRLLGVGPVAMGLLNGVLFALSFAALAWNFGWTYRQQAVALAVPALLFMGLPYSEAVFFGSGVLVLVGLRRGWPALYLLGLVLSCLSRSAAFVLLPAIGAAAVLTRRSWAQAARTAGAAGLAAGLGLGLSLAVHRAYLGRWLAFFEAQKFWDNHLQWPQVPLRNWGGAFPSLVEAPSFAIGLAALLYLGWLTRRHWQQPLAPAAAPLVFALTYLASVTGLVLATRGGWLVSLSRYVCATPYFLLVLAAFIRQGWLSSRQLLAVAGLLEVLWLVLFGGTEHIRTLLQFTVVTLVSVLWLANAHLSGRVRRAILAPTLLLGVGLLVKLLFNFLRNEWVA